MGRRVGSVRRHAPPRRRPPRCRPSITLFRRFRCPGHRRRYRLRTRRRSHRPPHRHRRAGRCITHIRRVALSARRTCPRPTRPAAAAPAPTPPPTTTHPRHAAVTRPTVPCRHSRRRLRAAMTPRGPRARTAGCAVAFRRRTRRRSSTPCRRAPPPTSLARLSRTSASPPPRSHLTSASMWDERCGRLPTRRRMQSPHGRAGRGALTTAR